MNGPTWYFNPEDLNEKGVGAYASVTTQPGRQGDLIAVFKNMVPLADKYARMVSAVPELIEVATLILREWEAPTEDVEKGELIARLSQYAPEARAALEKAGVR